jgi:hypothetical protein
MSLGSWFVGYLAAIVALVAALVAALLARYQPAKVALPALAGLGGWLVYGATIGYLGVVGDASLRPPGPALLLIPVFLFVALFLARSPAAARLALGMPLWIIIGAQAFRVGVEIVLHQLWIAGMAPRMLTYAGGNIDIVAGLSAPLVAWLCARERIGPRMLLAWNISGLATLANVALRAIMTAPGAFDVVHAEIPNLAIGTFPFTFIPGFFAPLALVLHVLAIRALRARLRLSDSAAAI